MILNNTIFLSNYDNYSNFFPNIIYLATSSIRIASLPLGGAGGGLEGFDVFYIYFIASIVRSSLCSYPLTKLSTASDM